MFVLRNPDVIILLKMYKFSFTQALHTVAWNELAGYMENGQKASRGSYVPSPH